MGSDLVNRCAKTLHEKGLNIAFIESATSGRMCSEFALTEFSGEILRGGLVCYSVFIKEQFLNVPQHLIEEYTPESAEVTKELANSGKRLFNSDVIVAVTGLTRTGGSETPLKPVGTMFIHIIIKNFHIEHREVFTGTSLEIMLKTVYRTAEIINSYLHKN